MSLMTHPSRQTAQISAVSGNSKGSLAMNGGQLRRACQASGRTQGPSRALTHLSRSTRITSCLPRAASTMAGRPPMATRAEGCLLSVYFLVAGWFGRRLLGDGAPALRECPRRVADTSFT